MIFSLARLLNTSAVSFDGAGKPKVATM